MKLKNIIAFVALVTTFSACDDLFEPSVENAQTVDVVFQNASSAQGILGYAYANLPFETKSTTDIATDDAVTNNLDNSYRAMAQGSWAATNDPMSQWVARKATIQYLNIFLENVESVKWSAVPHKQQMFKDHVSGEAYALRALNMYYLIRNHGGWVGDQLLGVPVITYTEGPGTDFNKARDTFQACVEQIYKDLDAAIELLPLTYKDLTSNDQLPAKYKEIDANYVDYNVMFGASMRGRIDGLICKAIKAQTALLASSPAFRDGTEVTSEEAANLAADVLKFVGGVSGMDPQGHKWYMQKEVINALEGGENPKEIIWRGGNSNGTADYDFGLSQELDNFPPTLYGNGRINPTQNLVDAFPMANGYPIEASGSGYSAQNPYADRDPRLSEYVMYNGTVYRDTEIITGSYSADDNGLNKIANSTRTGYYLRKLLRDDCNPNPSSQLAQFHYPVYIRFTEIFLAYAEAANEAWGPKGTGNNGYSAYDVIKAIRQRAGIGVGGNDPYLETCAGDPEMMRQLIRNERRIEMCFENKRFWDLRRWKADLNVPTKGMDVKQVAGQLQYNVIDVENRNYKDYMYYGPIPDAEVKKWSNLDQNTGW
ncbi:MAG: RagB/SusD family nutrient uptake outer membrane protein [Bacteroidales bacterium]|nr:RagB/SusD family nutrient uptake outer membrane protein [Bacteroidales bacterium]